MQLFFQVMYDIPRDIKKKLNHFLTKGLNLGTLFHPLNADFSFCFFYFFVRAMYISNMMSHVNSLNVFFHNLYNSLILKNSNKIWQSFYSKNY